MIHTHVRDRDGGHLLDATPIARRRKRYATRWASGWSIQITSEAVGRYKPAEQMAVVRAARPEAVSLALRELVPDAAHETAFAQFLSWLKSERIAPQIILYAPEEASALAAMQQRGLVPFDDIPVLYVLGRYTPGQVSQPADLLAVSRAGPAALRALDGLRLRSARNRLRCGRRAAGRSCPRRLREQFCSGRRHDCQGQCRARSSDQRRSDACGVRIAQANDLRAAWSIQG